MNFLKIFTTRNAFSREYGTWLIVIFNLAFVPIYLHTITAPVIIFFLSIISFLMFRFELLDVISTDIQFSKKIKIARSTIFFLISVFLFLYLTLMSFIEIKLATLIATSGVLMLFINIITRRKKGKRQNIFAQIILTCFVAFLGSLNYYLIKGYYDKSLLIIFILNALYYTNSIIYVRSKTVGSPYDVYALIFSIISILFLVFLANIKLLPPLLIIVFIPTLVKIIDNIVLSNFKVPLRRIGLNETLHSLIFIILFCLLF